MDNKELSKILTKLRRQGQWIDALRVFEFSRHKIRVDTISCNAAISACEKGGRWELALELLNECKTWSAPDTISYSAAISACEKGNQWQHALDLLRNICSVRVVPNTTSLDDEKELCNMVFANDLCHSHSFVLIIDLLQANEALDELMYRCWFYSPTLRRFQVCS